ncbi:hypothetical protein [Bernardetia sp. MNP-M8]|uniref:hypothetical protein n=1 Tax=Bernardetia sp. MNP-M8 TaxID=3127470 RepID=UPI0030CE1762
MIANKPIQHSISLIHFTIGVFCLSIFVLYLSNEAKWSLYSLIRKKESFFVILLGVISLFSFFGALSWLTTSSKTSKNISYLLSFFFLIEYIAILFISSTSREFVIALTPTVTPAVFLFLLAFSKISQFQENKIEYAEYNDYLDADFLVDKEEDTTTTFWKPNRIVSLTSFILAILLFPLLMSAGAPTWTIAIPSTFLVLCVVLWLFPKIGSWVSAILGILMGIGLIGLFMFLIFNKPFNGEKDKMYILGFIFLLVLSVTSLGWGLAMFLLSKEAQREWKR